MSIEEMIVETFQDPAMLAIIECESGLRQFQSDGTPLVSHTRDFGLVQVNEATWDEVAQELGLDYKHSLEDNLKMGKHIYEIQGRDAWVCAKMLGLVS